MEQSGRLGERQPVGTVIPYLDHDYRKPSALTLVLTNESSEKATTQISRHDLLSGTICQSVVNNTIHQADYRVLAPNKDACSWPHLKRIATCRRPTPPRTGAPSSATWTHVDRRIRRYVSAKRKLIALLEEEKQAVVNRAVTRGLDPNVRLKPSGVEWLGDVPGHWDIEGVWGHFSCRLIVGQQLVPTRSCHVAMPRLLDRREYYALST